MVLEFAEAYVRLRGGFWKHRNRMRGCKIKLLQRFYRLIYHLYLKSYGSYIGHSVKFVSEPCFPHGLHGVFIGGGVHIGENCVIFHHVTIGANPIPFSSKTGFPVIGNNCYIGAGATIVGAVRIGDNCRIGANSTVSCDVPDNSVVVSEKPRIIRKETLLINKYYKWSPKGPVYFNNGKWLLEKDEKIVENLKNKL